MIFRSFATADPGGRKIAASVAHGKWNCHLKESAKIPAGCNSAVICREPDVEDVDLLAGEHDNFEWQLALSDPQPEDEWRGIHRVNPRRALRKLLENHPAPEDCDYYVCGPPMMNAAEIRMLEDLGVERENILLDDFGD